MTGRRANSLQELGTRAPRFPIEMFLRYRPSGEIGWREGTTVNISRSGVLFQVDQLLEVGTPIEMSFALPVEIGGEAGAEVSCRAQVVRTVMPPSTDTPPAIAATILEYCFVRR